jgi:hypothetical protein
METVCIGFMSPAIFFSAQLMSPNIHDREVFVVAFRLWPGLGLLACFFLIA